MGDGRVSADLFTRTEKADTWFRAGKAQPTAASLCVENKMTSLPQTITSRSARADKLVISCLVVFLCLIHLVSLAQASGSASALHLVGDDGRIVLGDGTVSPIAVYKSDATTITIDGTLEVNDVRMQATGSTLSALFTMVNALTARLDTAESTIEQLALDRDAALQRRDWVEGNVTTRVVSAEASIAQLEVDRDHAGS